MSTSFSFCFFDFTASSVTFSLSLSKPLYFIDKFIFVSSFEWKHEKGLIDDHLKWKSGRFIPHLNVAMSFVAWDVLISGRRRGGEGEGGLQMSLTYLAYTSNDLSFSLFFCYRQLCENYRRTWPCFWCKRQSRQYIRTTRLVWLPAFLILFSVWPPCICTCVSCSAPLSFSCCLSESWSGLPPLCLTLLLIWFRTRLPQRCPLTLAAYMFKIAVLCNYTVFFSLTRLLNIFTNSPQRLTFICSMFWSWFG